MPEIWLDWLCFVSFNVIKCIKLYLMTYTCAISKFFFRI